MREKLTENRIENRPLFGCIPFDQPSYSEYKEIYNEKLPNAKYLGKEGFFVGCHPGLKEQQLNKIINAFDKIISKEDYLIK